MVIERSTAIFGCIRVEGDVTEYRITVVIVYPATAELR